jgi:predicted nucleic acid-binding Zn finger protein
MPTKQLQKRNSKAEKLRVLQSEDGQFFVENSEGKVLYNVVLNESETGCTCSDYAKNAKKDAEYKCKHILAVLNCVSSGDIVAGRFIEKPKPKLDERWIIEIEGNRFVKYAGLLEYAHALGISKIEATPIQLPNDQNGHFAICKATVISNDGKSFVDVGDASVFSTTARVSKHLLRMASTRAIARALRLFTGVGLTVLEELSDPNDALGNESGTGTKPNPKKQYGNKSRAAKPAKPKTKSSQSSTPPKTPKKTKQTKPDDTDKSDGNNSNGGNKQGKSKTQTPGKQPVIISSAQKKAIQQLSLRRGLSETETQEQVFDTYSKTLEELTQAQAARFIIHIQQST